MHKSLSESQKAAIEMLAIGRTLAAVCEALSIDPRTLYNWRKNRAFARGLDERREEVWSTAADRLRSLLLPAVEQLEMQLVDRYAPIRHRAANSILRIAALRNGVEPKSRKRGKLAA